MLPEDQKRLEREADIAKAVRGPDYRQLLESIARNKAEWSKRREAQADADAKARIQPVYGGVPQDHSQTQSLEASRKQITARLHQVRRAGPDM